ncbi:hypothetical protein T03_12645 [Trichinella britovi]|uniref:Uncharacterized protein n=1 Tax=Trichinella britovi TaxID=45882 RepID=A0A0V0YTN0_TRIBR|nr:hypothetical protein T03_12645 [Trichinella britovi]
MREELKDGGGGSCHMRSSTQSSTIIIYHKIGASV